MVENLKFVLTEECPQIPSFNASRAIRDAYGRWTKANDKDRVYILASITDVLAKKQEGMITAREIMDSMHDILDKSPPKSSMMLSSSFSMHVWRRKLLFRNMF